MRIRSASAGLVAVLLLPAAGAAAADQSVVVTSNLFAPADVTIQQGDTVTWTNSGGSHNVRFDDGSFELPAAPDSSPWSVARKFDSVGVFRYYCEAHGYPNGVDMSGAVYVNAAGTTPPPPPPGGLPVFADKTAPTLRLSGSRRQRVLGQRAVFVRAVVSEPSSVVARARIQVPGKAKPFAVAAPARRLEPRRVTNFRLAVRGRTLKTFRRGLRKHRRLTARITVTANDSAGNKSVAKRRVTLKK